MPVDTCTLANAHENMPERKHITEIQVRAKAQYIAVESAVYGTVIKHTIN